MVLILCLLPGCTKDSGANSADNLEDPSKVTRIHVGQFPTVVAPEGDFLWVMDRDLSTLSKLDPETNEVVDTVSLETGSRDYLWDMVSGSGSLWVTAPSKDRIYEIDGGTGEIASTIHPRGHVSDVYWAGDALWYADEHPQRPHKAILVRFDPETRHETNAGILGKIDDGVSDIVGFQDSVWVVPNHAEYIAGGGPEPTFYVSAELWEVDERGKEIIKKMPLGSTLTRGAVNPVIGNVEVLGGSLWFSWVPEQILAGMNPDTGEIVQKILLEEFTFVWEFAVSEGHLWVGNLNEGELATVNPESRDREILEVDVESSDVAAAFGSVWLTRPGLNPGDGQLLRIDSAN